MYKRVFYSILYFFLLLFFLLFLSFLFLSCDLFLLTSCVLVVVVVKLSRVECQKIQNSITLDSLISEVSVTVGSFRNSSGSGSVCRNICELC